MLFIIFTQVKKPLSQITFDFLTPRDNEPEDIKTIGKEEAIDEKEFLSGTPVSKRSSTKEIKSTRGRKSLKENEAYIDLVEVPDDEILFSKQYYSIGEVATMFHVNTSLIRFWENEFDILEPRKNRKGDRFFKPSDIKNLQMIYDLLRRRKFTIEGAKDFIKKDKQSREKYEMVQSLQKLKGFLCELRANL